jgi:hypothetical protein
MKAVLVSLVYIAISGGIGAVLGWWFVGSIGLAGVGGALVAVAIAVVVATACFAALTGLERAVRGKSK